MKKTLWISILVAASIAGCVKHTNPEAMRLCATMQPMDLAHRLDACATQNGEALKNFLCQSLPRHADDDARKVEFVFIMRSFDTRHEEFCRVY